MLSNPGLPFGGLRSFAKYVGDTQWAAAAGFLSDQMHAMVLLRHPGRPFGGFSR